MKPFVVVVFLILSFENIDARFAFGAIHVVSSFMERERISSVWFKVRFLVFVQADYA